MLLDYIIENNNFERFICGYNLTELLIFKKVNKSCYNLVGSDLLNNKLYERFLLYNENLIYNDLLEKEHIDKDHINYEEYLDFSFIYKLKNNDNKNYIINNLKTINKYILSKQKCITIIKKFNRTKKIKLSKLDEPNIHKSIQLLSKFIIYEIYKKIDIFEPPNILKKIKDNKYGDMNELYGQLMRYNYHLQFK